MKQYIKSKSVNRCRIGVDIGGTFTDIVLTSDKKPPLVKKVSSTPQNYASAVAEGIEALINEEQINPEEISDVVHATTVATNAILEGKGAHTGLITTQGFRDVLEFRRVRFPELYNLSYIKPKPLVERRDRLEVIERVSANGSVRIKLDETSVVSAALKLKERGVKAVAICLLHSYINPSHEKRVEEIIRDVMPADTFVCCSCDVLPEIREYERTSTTVVNAYLGPVLSHYLGQLRKQLNDIKVLSPLYVMQSGGGQMSDSAAMNLPAYFVESGPAAGVVAAAAIAKRAGMEQIITLDIGGTTAKTAIVEGGEPSRTSEYEVGAGVNLSSKLVKGAGYSIKLSFIDVSEIGAGGGSVVWFDDGGLMKVGPESAGSFPGPVCYDLGGDKVTLTDANLLLGYLNPKGLLGGRMKINREKAYSYVKQIVGDKLHLSVMDAAMGIFTVAVNNMVRAVKSVSTYRGRDPREFTLVTFGGNGAVLAAAIADELDITKFLVPSRSGVLSAAGLLAADTTNERVRYLFGVVDELDDDLVLSAFDSLVVEASTQLLEQGFSPIEISNNMYADLRYKGQAFELTVPVDVHAPKLTELLAQRFHEEHHRTYGHKSSEEQVELVSIKVSARVSKPKKVNQERAESTSAKRESRMAKFGANSAEVETIVILGRENISERYVLGPVIIEEYDSTIVVPPDWRAEVDESGNLIVSKGKYES
ncbi:hydantoinase/oxoprolinase family protein [Alphaproteobacteria bacterium]|nr:hydantoinase/oxoprolinase family protein [Alphaproteobacteria bacterium]